MNTTLAIAVRTATPALRRYAGAVYMVGILMLIAGVVRLASVFLGYGGGMRAGSLLWNAAASLVSAFAAAACGVFALAVAQFLRYNPESETLLPPLLLNLGMVRTAAVGALGIQLAFNLVSPLLQGLLLGVGARPFGLTYLAYQFAAIPSLLLALLLILGIGHAMQFAIQWRTWSVKNE